MADYNGMRTAFRKIPVDQLRECRFLLRELNPRSVEYRELYNSINSIGVLGSLLVRPMGNVFEIVDGYCRFKIASRLKVDELPCIIRELTDAEVLTFQVQANAVGITTKPLEYLARLEIIIDANPDFTAAQIGHLVNKSPSWMRDILSLRKLTKEAAKATARGEMTLRNAYALATLPPKLQDDFLQQACYLQGREFCKTIQIARKAFREAVKNGNMADYYASIGEATPYLRTFRVIKKEYFHPEAMPQVLTKVDAKSPKDGWNACLAWILHLDPVSITTQQKDLLNRHRKILEGQQTRKANRDKLRQLRKSTTT